MLGGGVAGVGLASCWEQLLLCRAVSGIGVSMLSTAAVLYVSDIRCVRDV